MSKINREQVENVAFLSRLKLTENEIEKMQQDMSAILDFIETINELDTTGIEPTSHVLDLKNVFREDEVGECMPNEEIMELAPESSDGSIVVPKVIG